VSAIGQLRHRLALERPVRSDDGAGGAVMKGEAMGDVWGAVEELGGGEQREGEQMSASRRLRVTLRHRPDIAPAWRLRLGLRLFEIMSLTRSGARGQWLSCDCIERDT
jgi:SPP1 family predicted phage head-tail adaptor